MRGTISVKVGHFRFDSDATLSIETDDDGTTLIFRDELSKHVWAALIDGNGRIINPVIRRGRGPALCTAVPPRIGPPFQFQHPHGPKPVPVRKTRKPDTRLCLVLQYTANRNPKQIVRILGGFHCGHRMLILYRSREHNTVVFEGQLLIENGRATTNDAVPPAFRLPDERWDEVLSLTDNQTFELNGTWRKVPLPELKSIVHAKRFQLSYEVPPDPD